MSQLIKRSLIKDNLAAYAPAYEHLYQYAGDTVTLMDPLDVANGFFPSSSTFTSRRRTASGLEAVFTANPSAPINHDTPPTLTQPSGYQGIIPYVTLNGTDENWTSPDAAYWSRDDSSGQGFSIGVWIKLASNQVGNIITKYQHDLGGSPKEWSFKTNGANKLLFGLAETGAGADEPFITSSTTFNNTSWYHVVVTYDGTGGATAVNGANMYVNGIVESVTRTNKAGYTNMSNTAAIVQIGVLGGTPIQYFHGSIACGPCSPWFTQIEMTADHIALIYNEQASLLGLRP